jgi:hypothetical protein
LLLAVFFGALWWFFSSVHAGLAYLGGAALVISPQNVDLGRIAAGERRDFEVSLQNMDRRPIKIVGARSSCTCIVIDGLPRTIEAGKTITLKARVVVPRDKPEFAQVLTYYTDSPESPKLAVRVRAVVSVPSSAPSS